jgi:aminoglycoside 3-N-acetyltransferase
MYTKISLTENFKNLGIKQNDNVLIHSSMKSIGEVEGGADTVLDVFCEYLAQTGNIALPAHSWDSINDEHNIFDPVNEPSCVGILTEIFRKRKGVLRSLHPTHSIAVMGKDAEYFVKNEHLIDTPCGRKGCWGKLLDMDFKIMFLGCTPKRNTYIHGVEEWCDVPGRITDHFHAFKIVMPDGSMFDRPMRRHHSPSGDPAERYDEILPYLEKRGQLVTGKFGDADCVVERAVDIYNVTAEILKDDINFFSPRV